MNTQELARANKVTVLVSEDGMTARFVRTHKLIAEVDLQTTEFKPDETKTKTAQREAFREFVIQNANNFGVDWKPEKMSVLSLPNKYTSKEELLEAAVILVTPELTKWVNEIGLTLTGITGTYVSEVDEYNGRQVSPRYANGNYAYANIGIEITVNSNEGDAVVTMECLLVSGQMKKPTKIGDANYNITNFKNEISLQLPDLFKKPEKEEVKEIKTPKVKEPKSDVNQSKPKPKSKKSKSDVSK